MATTLESKVEAASVQVEECYTLCLRNDHSYDHLPVGRNEPDLYEIPEGPYFPPATLNLDLL